jgi:hypothetical protein
VWPTHIGVGDTGGEPGTSPVYERGVIHWHPDNDPEGKGRLVGRALVHVPPGTYTHYIYHHGPEGGRQTAMRKMEHPLTFSTNATIEIWPIFNGDVLGSGEVWEGL